jgi:Rha family phage regulatory protein
MNELTVIRQNGGAYIDSREVAEYIGKRHDNLLRDIGKYREAMVRAGLLKIKESDFFAESSYVNAQNKVMPCYLLSKMACELVANKLTGDKGILFTIAYVKKFNEMERCERAELEKQAATPRLKVFNAAVRNVLGGFAYTRSSPDRVMNFLRGAYAPFGISVAVHRASDNHMTATDIAAMLGIFSESGRPHGHAVSAIIEKLGVGPEHIEIVPYGLVGIFLRYDSGVLEAVDDWIVENKYPGEVPHLGFEYHIYYENLPLFYDSYGNFILDDEDDDRFGETE